MKTSKKVKLMMSVVAVMAILIGCGDSNGDNKPQNTNNLSTKIGKGYYVDSAVEGIDYICGTQTGKTNKDGQFTFEKGKECKFSLAGIHLRTVLADELIDGKEILEDNPKVAKLLQSIDANGDLSDGIKIDNSVREALIKALKENNSVSKLPEGTVLTEVVASVGHDINLITGDVKTEEEVLTHITETRKEIIKKLLSNKTFYAVELSNFKGYDYDKIVVNKDVTSLTWTILRGVNSGKSKTEKISIQSDGGGIVTHGEIDGAGGLRFTKDNDDYLYVNDYFSIAPSSSTSYRYYFDKNKAEAYLDSLKPNLIPNNGENKAPKANAGKDQSVTVNSSIKITGTGTDSDGTIVSYEWKEGNKVLAKTSKFTYTPTTIGKHTLILKVTDNDGDSASDKVIVTVKALVEGNQPPKADAGKDQSVTVNETITLVGKGTDSDGTIIDYEWKKGSTILSTYASFTYTPNKVGKDTLTFMVTDDKGLTATDSVIISITPKSIEHIIIKKTGQTKSYDTNGNEVLDKSLKDDGFYKTGAKSNYTRDTDNEIVTDHLTGLMWQDNEAVASITKPWITQENYDICENDVFSSACNDTIGDTAIGYCNELVMGEYEDWRLPTGKELIGIIDYSRYNSAINIRFVNTYSDYYWSSISYSDSHNTIRLVNFYSGNQDLYDFSKHSKHYIRCVREDK